MAADKDHRECPLHERQIREPSGRDFGPLQGSAWVPLPTEEVGGAQPRACPDNLHRDV